MLALTRFQSCLTSNHCWRLSSFAHRRTYSKAARIRAYSMAHPTTSSSHPAQIPALDSPQADAGDKAPKEKKGKLANSSDFPLELQPQPAFFDHRLKIFNELKAEYDVFVAAQPREEIIVTMPDGSDPKAKSP